MPGSMYITIAIRVNIVYYEKIEISTYFLTFHYFLNSCRFFFFSLRYFVFCPLLSFTLSLSRVMLHVVSLRRVFIVK